MPIRFMTKEYEEEKVNYGAKGARDFHAEVDRLTKENSPNPDYPLFIYWPQTPDVEAGYDPNLKKEPKDQKLDYCVLHKGQLIAQLELSCTPKYTLQKPGRFMPIHTYKGRLVEKSKVPVFFIYHMNEPDLAFDEGSLWIEGEKVIIAPKKWIESEDENGNVKNTHDYCVNPKEWHHGLKDLIQELMKLVNP